MRKHGWQLPYHPLQVVAVSVFLALGFAFYVFFAPFVGKKLYQYIMMAIYTPLIVCVLGLYIWCAAADPADPGVFKSKKYLKSSVSRKQTKTKDSESRGYSNATMEDQNAAIKGEKSVDKDCKSVDVGAEDYEAERELKNTPSNCSSCILGVVCCPCTVLCKCMSGGQESCEQQISEDGMFYCSLCEVEVFKYSKHCRVCDKCVDCFDHHCRWINNCIGKRNYRKFFTLMVFSLLLLILQWSTGILVLIRCFVDRKRIDTNIVSKLGSSFSIAPFIIVVALCTILAMMATLPISQLFFFHILLIKKGISTYDYIIALREQEQQEVGGGQSPQMSQVSSLTGLSSASSFNRFHRTAWCTPPRLFLEEQFVVPPDTGSVSSYGKKMAKEEPIRKKNPAVKISPWTLARLNAAEVSKVAAEAKKRSQILKPVTRHGGPPSLETDSSISSSRRRMVQRVDSKRRNSKRIRLPANLPIDSLTSASIKASNTHWNNLRADASISLAPLQLEARSAFHTSLDMSRSVKTVASSPESSLESPDIHPFRDEVEAQRHLTGLSVAGAPGIPGLPLSRSNSDGYEASGGEDSDRVPTRSVQRPANWSNMLFGSNRAPKISTLKASSSFSQEGYIRKSYL